MAGENMNYLLPDLCNPIDCSFCFFLVDIPWPLTVSIHTYAGHWGPSEFL